jgi:hypothetical protein
MCDADLSSLAYFGRKLAATGGDVKAATTIMQAALYALLIIT